MSSQLERLGELLYHHGLGQFETYGLNTKFTTSDQVFERFVMGILDGMVKTEILERVKPKLFSVINEQKGIELCGKLSPQEFRDYVFQVFRYVGMGGLFPWERMANGILEVAKLAREFNGLDNLYPTFLQKSGNQKAARHSLLAVILGIPGISNKKALVLLRELHYQCDWDYPIDDLPMPVDTHIRVVLKRMGYVKGIKESQTDLEIQSAARSYFSIPLIVDLAVWDIGKRFCPKSGIPQCKGCPAFEYCKYSIEHYSR